MDTARAIAVRHATSNPLQSTPEGCFDTCWGAAIDLVSELRQEGVPSRKVLLRGWRGRINLPAVGNHAEWLAVGPDAWTHWVVLTQDGLFIDPTARQFDPGLEHPQFDRHDALAMRWHRIDGVRTTPEPPILF